MWSFVGGDIPAVSETVTSNAARALLEEFKSGGLFRAQWTIVFSAHTGTVFGALAPYSACTLCGLATLKGALAHLCVFQRNC
mmetsp:Transcript_55899/g.90575  ORF Transcript_55899/g.90575 Transcript_55899/m.90575 type:complete len:82 (+) Transcript_55899:77-322(+)